MQLEAFKTKVKNELENYKNAVNSLRFVSNALGVIHKTLEAQYKAGMDDETRKEALKQQIGYIDSLKAKFKNSKEIGKKLRGLLKRVDKTTADKATAMASVSEEIKELDDLDNLIIFINLVFTFKLIQPLTQFFSNTFCPKFFKFIF